MAMAMEKPVKHSADSHLSLISRLHYWLLRKKAEAKVCLLM
jgi:hypothetical protein